MQIKTFLCSGMERLSRLQKTLTHYAKVRLNGLAENESRDEKDRRMALPLILRALLAKSDSLAPIYFLIFNF